MKVLERVSPLAPDGLPFDFEAAFDSGFDEPLFRFNSAALVPVVVDLGTDCVGFGAMSYSPTKGEVVDDAEKSGEQCRKTINRLGVIRLSGADLGSWGSA